MLNNVALHVSLKNYFFLQNLLNMNFLKNLLLIFLKEN